MKLTLSSTFRGDKTVSLIPPSWPESISTSINLDYELGDVIGRGGFGVVMLARRRLGQQQQQQQQQQHQQQHQQQQQQPFTPTSLPYCSSPPPPTSYAVKKLFKHSLLRSSRPLSEINLLRTLHHPSLVPLFQIYEDPECVYLIMEYCEGGELFDRVVRSGWLEEKIVKMIAWKLCDALKYLHNR